MSINHHIPAELIIISPRKGLELGRHGLADFRITQSQGRDDGTTDDRLLGRDGDLDSFRGTSERRYVFGDSLLETVEGLFEVVAEEEAEAWGGGAETSETDFELAEAEVEVEGAAYVGCGVDFWRWEDVDVSGLLDGSF